MLQRMPPERPKRATVAILAADAGGEKSILNPGGSGVFTYAAESPLAASNKGPACTSANLNFFTVETADSVYGSKTLLQSFNTNGTTEAVGVTTQLRPHT
jgi:hypothetical protein